MATTPKFLFAGFVALGMSLLSSCGQDPATATVNGVLLKENVDNLMTKLNHLEESAIADGDYLLEKNVRRLELVAENLSFLVEEEMSRNRDFGGCPVRC